MELRLLDEDEARARIPELALILHDCVVKGASVGFMNPFSMAEAIGFYAECAENAANGEAFLFAAFVNGRAVGTVQLIPSRKPNQPHRGDIIKMLVHSMTLFKLCNMCFMRIKWFKRLPVCFYYMVIDL